MTQGAGCSVTGKCQRPVPFVHLKMTDLAEVIGGVYALPRNGAGGCDRASTLTT